MTRHPDQPERPLPPPPGAAAHGPPPDAGPPDARDDEAGLGEAVAEWVGRALAADAGGAAWRDARFVEWLAAEARAADRGARRLGDAAFLARGEAFLARALARRLGVRRLDAAPPPAPAPDAAAAAPGRLAPRQVRERPGAGPRRAGLVSGDPAAGERAAAPAAGRAVPVVELGVAAGPGRELWDEAPARWVALPDGVPDARYLALRVVGTSMAPLLRSGDVVLVRADARGREPRAGRVLVARHPDDGYVCKRVHAVGARRVVLASLEPGHAPLALPRDPALVVGTVVAAWAGR